MWIAHLSDPHVRPDGVLYQGVVDAHAALAKAVAQINAFRPKPALVLLTGDVVDEGDAAEYAAAQKILARLEAPLLAIPGNHDEREAFRRAFANHKHLPTEGPLHFCVDAGPLRVVGFDITVPGEHHGDVTREAADWLERALAKDASKPTLLLMHQPPLETEVPYLDAYRCFGAERLAEIVSRYPAIERIVCGHVHRHMLMRFAGTTLCTAPSTATTIALQPLPDASPASFLEPPAFLLHHWSGQRLLTHLVPVGDFLGPFPFA